jgi:hypothetical protein
LISGPRERRRREMLGSTLVSVLVHLVVLALLFSFVKTLVMKPAGSSESVSETTTLALEHRMRPKPRTQKKANPKHRPPAPPAAAAPAMHELARESPLAPPQPPPQHVSIPRTTSISTLQRDRGAFAAEVAQLNKGNDAHAIPTIDPGARASAVKSYGFEAGAGQGEGHGNGIITPVQSWHQGGKDCYFARYEYTYASGAMEDGTIVWPICYDPASDPFHEPPHPMPFPPPPLGYVLPAGTDLPPLEKEEYQAYEGSAPH